MTTIKRCLVIILTISMVLMAAACSKKNQDKTEETKTEIIRLTNTICDTIVLHDSNRLFGYCDSQNLDEYRELYDEYMNYENAYRLNYGDERADLFKAILDRMTYEIDEESVTIADARCRIDVTFEVPDINALIEEENNHVDVDSLIGLLDSASRCRYEIQFRYEPNEIGGWSLVNLSDLYNILLVPMHEALREADLAFLIDYASYIENSYWSGYDYDDATKTYSNVYSIQYVVAYASAVENVTDAMYYTISHDGDVVYRSDIGFYHYCIYDSPNGEVFDGTYEITIYNINDEAFLTDSCEALSSNVSMAGNYVATVDETEMFTSIWPEDMEFEGELWAEINCTLNEDGTYVVWVDNEVFIDDCKALILNNTEGFLVMSGYTLEDLQAAYEDALAEYEQTSEDVSEDELTEEESTEPTYEDVLLALVEDILENMDYSYFLFEEIEGTYSVTDERIVYSSTTGSTTDGDINYYRLTGDFLGTEEITFYREGGVNAIQRYITGVFSSDVESIIGATNFASENDAANYTDRLNNIFNYIDIGEGARVYKVLVNAIEISIDDRTIDSDEEHFYCQIVCTLVDANEMVGNPAMENVDDALATIPTLNRVTIHIPLNAYKDEEDNWYISESDWVTAYNQIFAFATLINYN